MSYVYIYVLAYIDIDIVRVRKKWPGTKKKLPGSKFQVCELHPSNPSREMSIEICCHLADWLELPNIFH